MISSIPKWLNKISMMRIQDQAIHENLVESQAVIQAESQMKVQVKEVMMTWNQESLAVRQVLKSLWKAKTQRK